MDLKFQISIAAEAPGFAAYAALIAEAAPAPLIAEGNPPLILYTSGTTGLPKGVVMGRPDVTDPQSRQEIAEYMKSVGDSRPQTPGARHC